MNTTIANSRNKIFLGNKYLYSLCCKINTNYVSTRKALVNILFDFDIQ